MIKIKRLLPQEFVKGKRYTLEAIPKRSAIINSAFVDCISDEFEAVKQYQLIFTNDREKLHYVMVAADEPIKVIEHSPEPFFIRVGKNFLIGSFTSQIEANEYVNANKGLLYKLKGANSGQGICISMAESVEKYISFQLASTFITPDEDLNLYITKR